METKHNIKDAEEKEEGKEWIAGHGWERPASKAVRSHPRQCELHSILGPPLPAATTGERSKAPALKDADHVRSKYIAQVSMQGCVSTMSAMQLSDDESNEELCL